MKAFFYVTRYLRLLTGSKWSHDVTAWFLHVDGWAGIDFFTSLNIQQALALPIIPSIIASLNYIIVEQR